MSGGAEAVPYVPSMDASDRAPLRAPFHPGCRCCPSTECMPTDRRCSVRFPSTAPRSRASLRIISRWSGVYRGASATHGGVSDPSFPVVGGDASLTTYCRTIKYPDSAQCHFPTEVTPRRRTAPIPVQCLSTVRMPGLLAITRNRTSCRGQSAQPLPRPLHRSNQSGCAQRETRSISMRCSSGR